MRRTGSSPPRTFMRIIPLPAIPSHAVSTSSSSSSRSTSSGQFLGVPQLPAHVLAPAALPAHLRPQLPAPSYRPRSPEIFVEPSSGRRLPPPLGLPDPQDMAHQYPYLAPHKLQAYQMAYHHLSMASISYHETSDARLRYWVHSRELRNIFAEAQPPPPYSP